MIGVEGLRKGFKHLPQDASARHTPRDPTHQPCHKDAKNRQTNHSGIGAQLESEIRLWQRRVDSGRSDGGSGGGGESGGSGGSSGGDGDGGGVGNARHFYRVLSYVSGPYRLADRRMADSTGWDRTR